MQVEVEWLSYLFAEFNEVEKNLSYSRRNIPIMITITETCLCQDMSTSTQELAVSFTMAFYPWYTTSQISKWTILELL